MTARSEAINIISELPDVYVENVLGILQNLKVLTQKSNIGKVNETTLRGIDFSGYGHRTDRGQDVDGYMREMRNGDRL